MAIAAPVALAGARISHCSACVAGSNHTSEMLPVQLVGAWITVQLASAARASYPSIVAAVAIAIAGSAASGTWLRLKSCPAPHCGRAFHDDSPSSAARHCSLHVA